MKRRFRHRLFHDSSLALQRSRLQEPPPENPDAATIGLHMIAIEGHWEGHVMGAFSLDEHLFQQMVDHFDGKRIDTVADYEHASFWGSMFGMKAEASGWIKGLEVRTGDDGAAQLWARVDWTSTAAKHIREREYRYLSPVIVWNTVDHISGEMVGASIHSLALTNTPFLEELPDVRLNSLPAFTFGEVPTQQEEDPMDEKQLRALAATLGLSAELTAEELPKAISDATTMLSSRTIVGAAALEALSLPVDADKEQATAAILKLQDPNRSTDRVAALEQQIANMRADDAKSKAEAAVAAAFSAGKISGPDSDEYKWALKLAASDPAAFAEGMALRKAQVPTGDPKQHQQREAQDVALSDEHTDTLKQVGMSPEDFAKYDRPVAR